MNRKLIYFLAVAFIVASAALAAGFDKSQAVAVTTLASLISATFLFWRMRVAFAFLGVSALLAFGLVDVPHFVEFASLDIIAFLIAMMILVGYLEENKFFEYLTSKILNHTGHNGRLMLFIILIIAGVSAALVDEVTSILIMIGIVLHLVNKLDLNPVPFVLMLIFATNIGSSATVVGNPVGVLIALRGGLTFADFIRWAAPISLVSLLIAIGIMFVYFRKYIDAFSQKINESREVLIEPVDGRSVRTSATLFAGVLLILLLHTQIEEMLSLEKNSMLLGASFLGAGFALLAKGDNARNLLETRVDWWTLIFFMLLFSTVGALKFSGITDKISGALQGVVSLSPEIGIAVVMFSSGMLSAALDNVLAVAIFIPVIQSLIAQGAGNDSLWWALLFGGTFFGNLTVIGSTANIVAVGLLERRTGTKISFSEWLKIGALVTIPTVVFAFVALVIQVILL